MTITTFIGAIALLCIAAIAMLSHGRAKPLREGLSGVGGLLTLSAALLGVYWYLQQRPDAARIAYDIDAKVLRLDAKRLLVVSEVAIENRGASVLHFRDGDELKLFLQRVTPLDPAIAAGLTPRDADGMPRTEAGDNWVLMSRIVVPLAGVVLEAQETEHFYFHTVVDCAPGLSFYVQAKMNAGYYAQRALGLLSDDDKRGKVWIRQQLIDAGEQCREERR